MEINKYKFLGQYEKMIYNCSTDEQNEEKMFDKLKDIEDMLLELEHDIEEAEKTKHSIKESDYYKQGDDFLYANALPAYEFRR